MAPKLSICIPTYNRASYLDSALSHVFDDRPVSCDFEVIVTNNGSGDNTDEVLQRWAAREPSLRVWRQTRNVGGSNNLHCAFRLARGEYLAYLADDDRLIPGQIDRLVRTLDDTPALAAIFAPWEVQNERTGQSYGTHFQVPEEKVFSKTNSLELLNYIFTQHIFPEQAIYRASAMHKMAPTPFKAYYAFVTMIELLDMGDLLFVADPFYICRVPVETGPQMRRTAGGDGVVNDRDNYQAGLEYLVLKCFSHVGDGEMQQIPVVRQMIDRFMDIRLVHAKDALVRDHNWRGIYEFVVRMRARGLIARNDSLRLDRELGLSSRAAIQAFLEIFDTMTGLEEIGVVGYAEPADPIRRIEQQRPGVQVRVLGDEAAAADANKDRRLVLAGPSVDRPALVAAGYLPGAIVAEADLLRQFAA